VHGARGLCGRHFMHLYRNDKVTLDAFYPPQSRNWRVKIDPFTGEMTQRKPRRDPPRKGRYRLPI
jgi:hypothetical protein